MRSAQTSSIVRRALVAAQVSASQMPRDLANSATTNKAEGALLGGPWLLSQAGRRQQLEEKLAKCVSHSKRAKLLRQLARIAEESDDEEGETIETLPNGGTSPSSTMSGGRVSTSEAEVLGTTMESSETAELIAREIMADVDENLTSLSRKELASLVEGVLVQSRSPFAPT